MPGFLRAATIVLGSSAVLGASALAARPSAPEGAVFARLRMAGVAVADLPRVGCKQQLWPNTDRICQSWTIAQPDVARYLSTKLAPAPSALAAAESGAAPSQPQRLALEHEASAAVQKVDGARETAHSRVLQPAPEEKPRAPAVRSRVGQNGIAVAARAGDGSTRMIIIRPTSRQDHLYYSAHRDLAATAFPLHQ
jgi:pyruvate/2-oxoglutarate dehydrogenase complex dihydrolipoamide acyltransferase (E2) component